VARAATTHRRLTCCEVRGEGTKAVGKVCRARRSEAGLTQIACASVGQWGGAHTMAFDGGEAGSVVENDGRGARLAAHRADERRLRCGQLSGEGWCSDGGGPAARGGGEGGDYERGVGAKKKTRRGGEKSGRRRRHHPFKGGRQGHNGGGGGSGEVRRCVEGLEEGALAPTGGGQLGRCGTTGSSPVAVCMSAQWRATPGH
jgi:hypothetical protein